MCKSAPVERSVNKVFLILVCVHACVCFFYSAEAETTESENNAAPPTSPANALSQADIMANFDDVSVAELQINKSYLM